VDTVPGVPAPSPAERAADVDRLVDHLVAPRNAVSEEDRRDVAERLHALGTAEALARLEARGADPLARALLRDSRWDVPGAGEVPCREARRLRAGMQLARLRWHHASRQVRARWTAAASGGLVRGVRRRGRRPAARRSCPQQFRPPRGRARCDRRRAGALGGAGIGAGLEAAEALARSRRGLALVVCGGLGGSLVALLARWVVSWTLEALFGLSPNISAGPLEGRRSAPPGPRLRVGHAATRGWGHCRAASARPTAGCAAGGLCCGLAAIALGALGRQMVGGVVNETARPPTAPGFTLSARSHHRRGGLRATDRMLIGAAEGAVFGFGLALGLTKRPRP